MGGFLLGGAYSVTKLDNDGKPRGPVQLAVAVLLAVLAVYLVVTGILRVAQE